MLIDTQIAVFSSYQGYNIKNIITSIVSVPKTENNPGI